VSENGNVTFTIVAETDMRDLSLHKHRFSSGTLNANIEIGCHAFIEMSGNYQYAVC
jgi:hypothetical protein